MLYNFLYPLKDVFFAFNIFKYITFRSGCAALTSFLICIIFGPLIIRKLSEKNIGEKIKLNDCPGLHQLHLSKEGTPTMGGILIFVSIIGSVILWADMTNKYILLSIFVFMYLGILGLVDDYIKLTRHNKKGLSMSCKFLFQCMLGLIIGVVLFLDKNIDTKLYFPFFKALFVDLGIFYIFFVALVIVGSSNAVNLSDGLDGLAVGCTLMVAIAFTVLTYVSGHITFSKYLFIPYIANSGELTIFCTSIIGACLGFLWFNCHPASVFMGDVGSLPLGGSIAAIAVFIKKEIVLLIVGGVFVLEAVSVILQVASFKLRGKRIFKVAPIHHHFQMLGWHESKVIVRFWILGALFALLALISLKLR